MLREAEAMGCGANPCLATGGSGGDASAVHVAIACGGTGGHLFPGLAVAEVLRDRGVPVTLFVSPKGVDQQALRGTRDIHSVVLPVAGWQRGTRWRCAVGMIRSLGLARNLLVGPGRWVVLGMGGFTSVPVVMAGLWAGWPVFLHESNAVAGRANRWLARWVDGVMVGFRSTEGWRNCRRVAVTGTPVRRAIVEVGALDNARRAERRRRVLAALGLDPEAPVVLVVGGSQGAHPLNVGILACLDRWEAAGVPMPQWIHLTGDRDEEVVRVGYELRGVRAVVRGFSDAMADLLAAATVVVSRAGASFLAELSAVGVPALLIPFPAAAEDHQRRNAQVWMDAGAARMLVQSEADPERLAVELGALLKDERLQETMVRAQRHWHAGDAARRIAEILLGEAGPAEVRARRPWRRRWRGLAGQAFRVNPGKTGEAKVARICRG